MSCVLLVIFGGRKSMQNRQMTNKRSAALGKCCLGTNALHVMLEAMLLRDCDHLQG